MTRKWIFHYDKPTLMKQWHILGFDLSKIRPDKTIEIACSLCGYIMNGALREHREYCPNIPPETPELERARLNLLDVPDLLEYEYQRLRHIGMVYFSKPYSCCHDEAMTHLRKFFWKPLSLTLIQSPKESILRIKLPVSGQIYTIKLWVP